MSNKSFADLNTFAEISPPEHSPQDIATSFSELVLPEELPTDYAEAASHQTEKAVVFSPVNNNIDEKVFDIDLTKIEDIPEISQSKSPQPNSISTSQPASHRSGTYNMASASASVRAVNSPNIVNKSFTVSAGFKPTQATDSQDLIGDDLPVIKPPEIPKRTSKIKQISKIKNNTLSQTESRNELDIDYILGDKYNPIKLDTGKNSTNFKVLEDAKGRVTEIGADSITSRALSHAVTDTSNNDVISIIDIDSKNNSLLEENIDDLNQANSNFISQDSDDLFIVKTDFDQTNSDSDRGSRDYSIEVNLKNGIVASTSDNLFDFGKNQHILGGEADDKLFVESGDGSILFGGTDQF